MTLVNSTDKNKSTTILGRLSARVATSATKRLQFLFLVPLASAVAAFFVIGIVALRIHEQDTIESDVNREQALVEKLYREDIEHKGTSGN